MAFLDNLNWRYATKKFNGDPVSPGDVQRLETAIRMAPSSAGTQPYHVIVIENPDLKDALIASSKQFDKLQCSHLLVFCARTDYPDRADAQIAITAETQNVAAETLSGLRATIDRTTVGKTPQQLLEWAARQAYIALGFAIAACAELHIDACPMEGFNPEEFHALLSLPDHIRPVVLLAIGHRDQNDSAQPSLRPKVRFSKTDLFETR